MPPYRIDQLSVHAGLQQQAVAMEASGAHLKKLLAMPQRLKNFSAQGGGLFFDFSRQRVDAPTMALLFQAARDLDLNGRFARMSAGEKINCTSYPFCIKDIDSFCVIVILYKKV